jgi:hypothetical protein
MSPLNVCLYGVHCTGLVLLFLSLVGQYLFYIRSLKARDAARTWKGLSSFFLFHKNALHSVQVVKDFAILHIDNL